MSFRVEFKKYTETAENWLKKAPIIQSQTEQTLKNAMEYSLLAGGKRLRPVLSLAVCDMLKGDPREVMPFAGALEFIHTYSLIHDDLPCMDNDDFRRGKPTSHKVFGEAIAVLAGDALLNAAYEILFRAIQEGAVPISRKVKAAEIIAEAAGGLGMVGGQVIDLESENKQIDYGRLCTMHKKKTGALIRAAVQSAAVLCAADEKLVGALTSYAENIGLAFQIKDDILDFEGLSCVVGKPLGSDSKNNKSTFVTLLGMQSAKELLKKTEEAAVQSLSGVSGGEFLIRMAAFIAEREK